MKEIDDDFARAEGRGYSDVAQWRAAHEEFDELDRDGRTAFGIKHPESLSGIRYCLAGVLVDLQETRERGFLTAQDRRQTTVTFRTREGEFKSRKSVMSHRARL
ncbi:hypothetical protein AB0L10_38825 [Streptomyces flaveolus]|uniref:hypothetical protein n=1 Tax=Streptomyces flaveolus TaxID=67297 RepID=UPI003428CD3B